jgi:hypothetical protein
MSQPQWIATSSVVFVQPDGTRVPGSIRISLPEPAFERAAQCFYNLDPVVAGRAIYGDNSLQALLLALRMCGVELALFERRGGRVEFPPDETGSPGSRWDPSATFGAFFQVPP